MHLRWFLVVSVFSYGAFCGPKVELLTPRFWGAGCQKGSADVSISANAKRIDLTFQKFVAQADSKMGDGTKKECNAMIRIKVPHGFSVAVQRVKYKGASDLPYGTNAHLAGAHFFNGADLATFSKRYHGRSLGRFSVETVIPNSDLNWTPCGEEAVLASRTTLALSAKKSLAKAIFQIHGENVRSGISYNLLWRSCAKPLLPGLPSSLARSGDP